MLLTRCESEEDRRQGCLPTVRWEKLADDEMHWQEEDEDFNFKHFVLETTIRSRIPGCGFEQRSLGHRETGELLTHSR